jgi:hypothetical protein
MKNHDVSTVNGHLSLRSALAVCERHCGVREALPGNANSSAQFGKGNRQLGRTECRWKDDIKINHTQIRGRLDSYGSGYNPVDFFF